MKTRTHLNAGRKRFNHNETLVRDAAAGRRLHVRTGVKAGGKRLNHNETLVRDTLPAPRRVFLVRTAVLAGGVSIRR